eukprot:5049072-Amphidinium_carterae.1
MAPKSAHIDSWKNRSGFCHAMDDLKTGPKGHNMSTRNKSSKSVRKMPEALSYPLFPCCAIDAPQREESGQLLCT